MALDNAGPAPGNSRMTKKDLMKRISDAVGPQEAVRLVTDAYNSEILANRMSRMETEPSGIRRTEKRDLLQQALERVIAVVELV
jgi:hypothetical protein